jgi:hypothetical protein
LQEIDPATCAHARNTRLGIQRFPFPPFRVYLLRCQRCATTITTDSMRELRNRSDTSEPTHGGGPATA